MTDPDRNTTADALTKFDHCTGGWVCPAVAHFHGCHCDDGNCDRPAEHTAVPLRADPDTSDELFEMFAGNDHIANNVVSWPDGDHVATVLPPVRPSRSARPVAGPGSDRVGSTVGGGSGSGRVALGLVPGGGS